MTNTSLDLTNASSKLLTKLLESVPMSQRDAAWNQLNRDVRRINEIWSRIGKENKLNAELIQKRLKSSPIK
jgi:hypothetical protein